MPSFRSEAVSFCGRSRSADTPDSLPSGTDRMCTIAGSNPAHIYATRLFAGPTQYPPMCGLARSLGNLLICRPGFRIEDERLAAIAIIDPSESQFVHAILIRQVVPTDQLAQCFHQPYLRL